MNNAQPIGPKPTSSSPDVAVLLPSMELGGAERVTQNLVNGFAQQGLKVHLLLLRPTGMLLPLLDPGVEIWDLKAPKMRHAWLPLLNYLRQKRPRCLIAHMWPLTIIAVLARLFSRSSTRLILVEHTVLSEQYRAHPWRLRQTIRLTTRLLYPLASQVVAVSDGVADNLARFTGLKRSRIRAVYNPVARLSQPPPSPSCETPLPGLDWWTAKGKRVLAVGTLKPEKGYDTLLQAFKRVADKLDARLLIVGEGPERENLAHLVGTLGLSEHVLLCGAVLNAEPYYPQADLFVLSSLFEGLPTVLIEALAAGTPIVSTDCPSGPREILQGGRHGQLVPPGQPQLLAEAILSSLAGADPGSAQRRQDRARDFSIERGIENYLQLLSD